MSPSETELSVRVMPDGRVVLGNGRVLGTLHGSGRNCQAKPTVAALGGGGFYAYRIDAIRGLARGAGYEIRRDGRHLTAVWVLDSDAGAAGSAKPAQ